MPLTGFQETQRSLRAQYLGDQRAWLVDFSGGKDSTLVAAVVFEAKLAGPSGQGTAEIHVACNDTCAEISTVVETIETGLASCGAALRLKP